MRIHPAGDPFSACAADDLDQDREVCSHCFSSGWVIMTAENDFGEDEDYYVLCRKCKDHS